MSQVHGVSRFSLFLALAFVAVAPSALAAGDSSWYVQGKFGDVGLDARFGANWTKQIDDDDAAASVEVGYTAHRYLAFQAGYHDLGEHAGGGSPCPQSAEICVLEVAPVRAELTGLSLAAVPKWSFNDRWSAFGKVGVMDWRTDMALDRAGSQNRRIESYDDRDVLTGVGVQFELPRGFGLVLERQSFDLTGGWTSFGASWRF